MGSWWRRLRTRESGLENSLAASGAYAGGYDGIDPDDVGFRRYGSGRREVPAYTLSKVRALSVHQYRANPMGRAMLDTYTSFVVGDSGLTLQCANPDVREIAEDFWDDPRNDLGNMHRQELLLRAHMLMGETALEMMAAPVTGVTRFSYIDPEQICRVELDRGNPLWPKRIFSRDGINEIPLDVVAIDDLSRLRTGEVFFWRSWQALPTDRRGWPFLGPVLDWLQAYDDVLWNLIDRTALSRYMVWDVTVNGDQSVVDAFIEARKGTHAPASGSVEVHNESVKWEPKTPQVGAYEDKVTAQQVLTNIAGGGGLAKTWLAEPEDANRATSLTMAEPVRRRIGGIQNLWLGYQAELVRFAVDRAVAAGRLPDEVDVDTETGTRKVPPAKTVKITGPEIAAADAKVNAEILAQLGNSLTAFQAAKLLTPEACKVAAKKAWEDFVGIPYSPELDKAAQAGDTDMLAEYLDDQTKAQLEAERGRRRALLP